MGCRVTSEFHDPCQIPLGTKSEENGVGSTQPHAGDTRTAAGRHRRSLAWTLGLTVGFLLIEVAGGLWTGSLALLADAGHMLADAAGLGLSLLAIWFAGKPATHEKTYGYYRVEILAALANSLVLFFISGFILYGAYHRFRDPPEILSGPMLGIAVLGLGVNLVGMWLLHGGAGKTLNLRGAYLEVMADALGSLGVILAAVIMLTTGWYLADPLISAGIGLFILPRTWGLMRQVVNILLEGAPSHLDIHQIEVAMANSHGVRAVHDLHVWTLTSGKEAMSAHVLVEDLADGQHILGDLQQLLRDEFGIEHTTIQLETDRPPLIQIGFPSERFREGTPPLTSEPPRGEDDAANGRSGREGEIKMP